MLTPKRKSQRGFTLTEVVVATAIFAIVVTSALLVYDRANRVFKTGVESSEMQQNVRVGYDKMVQEVRMAGFDHDRDGIPTSAGGNVWQPSKVYGVGNIVTPITANGFTYRCVTGGQSGAVQPAWSTTLGGITIDGLARWETQGGINQYQQPDEQIEYAGAHALTIRGNFDYETDTANQNGREPSLESAQFPVVTTGNDEIVTYALVSTAAGAPNSGVIEFYADIPNRRAYPGGRAENPVRITGVDLCTTGCNNPPYTLFRFTLANDGTVVRSPLANNVRDLTLRYYSSASAEATSELTFAPSLTSTTPPSSGGGQYNPNNPVASTAARGQRARIKAVRVSLTGMGEAPEMGYDNPQEAATSAANSYKTFSVESLVIPRNVGKMGSREQQSSPPGAPRLQRACRGYCGVAYVEWLAPQVNDVQGPVEQYVVVYDTVTPPTRFTQNVGPSTFAYIPDLDATQSYYFTVTALNSFGSQPAANVVGPLSARNETTPGDPSNLIVSGGTVPGAPAAQQNQISLEWSNPTTESGGSQTCVVVPGATASTTGPPGPAPGEISNYQILRGETADFNPGDPDEYVVVSTDAPNSLIVGPSTSNFVDATAVPCKSYYYRIRGIEDACYPEGGGNNAGGVDPITEIFPRYGSASAILGIATASAPPAAPITLLFDPASNCGTDCDIYLKFPKVKQDTSASPKPMTIETYQVTRERWLNGALDDTVVFDVTDATPGSTTEAYFTSDAAGAEQWYLDENLPAVYVNPDTSTTPYQYRYTVQAKLNCSPAMFSAPSPELRYPCVFTGGAPAISISNVIDGGPATTVDTAWLTDGSGGSVIGVTGAGIQSVQVLVSDLASSFVTDYGTVATAPFNFTLSGLEPGSIYLVYIVSRDASGCLDIQTRYVEEGTPSGCCLAAQADNPLVVQFSPGSSIVDLYLFNQCGDPLQVQNSGILLQWNPGLTPSGTRLERLEFPASAGGRTLSAIGDTSGTVTTSVPVPGLNPIPAESTYRIQLQFNQLLSTNPLTNACITYLRPGIDDPTEPQRCRIVPEPSADPLQFNTCN